MNRSAGIYLVLFIFGNLGLFANGAKTTDILRLYNVKHGAVEWSLDLHEAGIDVMVKNNMAHKVIYKTQLVFLEEGNNHAGLLHIWSGHGADFKNMLGIRTKGGVSTYIETIMGLGHYATEGYTTRNTNRGLELSVVYHIVDDLFLKVAIGTNGFIVTAFPLRRKDLPRDLKYETKHATEPPRRNTHVGEITTKRSNRRNTHNG